MTLYEELRDIEGAAERELRYGRGASSAAVEALTLVSRLAAALAQCHQPPEPGMCDVCDAWCVNPGACNAPR